MNTELLLKVKERILAHPKALEMATWGIAVPESTHCGTLACIAGHAVHIATGRVELGRRAERTAKELLGISPDQAFRLFFVDEWPPNFFNSYANTKDKVKAAKVAADRIDHFIATGE
jgi:hypothetical protein